MTRDETIELFGKCEQARANALAEGKSLIIANEASRAIWNSWAIELVQEQRALEQTGKWDATSYAGLPSARLIGNNEETRAWIDKSFVDFHQCKFLPENTDYLQSRTPQNLDSDEDIRIRIRSDRINFSGFLFPGTVDFSSGEFFARVDFLNTSFHDKATFEHAVFHYQTNFRNSRFLTSANFKNNEFVCGADFPYVNFHGHSNFDDTFFRHTAGFGYVNFYSTASFRKAIFESRANFEGIRFQSESIFAKSTFKGNAIFGRSHFCSECSFFRAEFQNDAVFDRSTFQSPSFYVTDGWFVRTIFKGPAFFRSCQFAGGGDFRSVRSEVGLDMSDAEFGRVPDFTQSTMHRDPRLDNVTVKRGSLLGPVLREPRFGECFTARNVILHLLKRFDRDAPAKFRELKRMAIQGEDHRSELRFHAHEIRTSRFVHDWPHQPRFWFGVGYELLSNFGRSILRPALAWGVLVTLFAGIYLSISAAENGRVPDYASLAPYGGAQSCLSAPADADTKVRELQPKITAATSASAEAWSLALKNGFVFIDWDRAEAARRTYGCLFGLTSDGSNTYPVVPRAVSVAGLIQNVLSAVLIFLLLLGIRNLLKLK